MRLAALGALGALVGCQSLAGLTDRSEGRASSGYAGEDAVAGAPSAGGADSAHDASEEAGGRPGRVDRASGGVLTAASEAGAAGKQVESAAAGQGGETGGARGGAGGPSAVTGGGQGGSDVAGQGATVDGGTEAEGGAGASGLGPAGFSAGGSATGGAATADGGGAEAGGVAIGGVETGGASTGGAAAGSDAVGGTEAAGAGGAATGGAATGGTSTGGAAAGSDAVGGAEAAGAAAGGAATGGMATGGASTGGAATGGAATGGSSTGGATGGVIFPVRFAGNTDTSGSIRSDFATYWDQFSPENAGQWGSVQPSSASSYNWNSLDAMYSYCDVMGIPFKEHAFVGGTQQPGWVDDSNAESAVRQWMSTFCDRYPNVALIDVVNDPPPHTSPGYKDGIGGDGTTGWDWIANLFTWAREACPKAVLILNDYNNIEYSAEAQNTVDIVNAIQSLGAPIDAVGCQAHGTAQVDTSTLQSNLDKIANETGLPTFITEYDLNIADDDLQAQVMRDHFTMFWQNHDVKGITLWGYIVGSTWQQYSGLMHSDGTMRPAMTWLMQFLDRGGAPLDAG